MLLGISLGSAPRRMLSEIEESEVVVEGGAVVVAVEVFEMLIIEINETWFVVAVISMDT